MRKKCLFGGPWSFFWSVNHSQRTELEGIFSNKTKSEYIFQKAFSKNIILHAQHKNEQNMVSLNAKLADKLALQRFLVDFFLCQMLGTPWLSMVIRFVSPLYYFFFKTFASDHFVYGLCRTHDNGTTNGFHSNTVINYNNILLIYSTLLHMVGCHL
jgi:hypothetical protein